MERRDFLRGTLLSAPAVLLGPGLVDLVGSESAHVAVLDPEPVADEPQTRAPIMHILDRRQRAHATFFGTIPEVMFVNQREWMDYYRALGTTLRYSDTRMGVSGLDTLLFRNTVVATVDEGVLFLNTAGE